MLIQNVISALKQTIPEQKMPVSLHEPSFNGNEWKYVKDCIDSGWVSSVGEYVNNFEKKLIQYTGAKYAVATTNGTSALHTCLEITGIEKDNEVLAPSLTFVATANAISYCNAVPHFVDVSLETLGVCPQKLRSYLKDITELKQNECFNKNTGRKIHSLLLMHTFGHPADLDELLEVCNEFKIKLIEDAAESLGSFYKNKHTGVFGSVSAVSFNGNKTITTGGGGVVLTNNQELANRAFHLTKTARVAKNKWDFYHDEVGYNYRLPNLNAALGCAQMEKLPEVIIKKRALAKRYEESFEGIAGVKFFVEKDYAQSNYWLNVMILDEEFCSIREELLEETNKQGFMTRPIWMPMHKLPMYSDCPKSEMTNTENLEKRVINLPSSSFL